jgi:hypothetical protein
MLGPKMEASCKHVLPVRVVRMLMRVFSFHSSIVTSAPMRPMFEEGNLLEKIHHVVLLAPGPLLGRSRRMAMYRAFVWQAGSISMK